MLLSPSIDVTHAYFPEQSLEHDPDLLKKETQEATGRRSARKMQTIFSPPL